MRSSQKSLSQHLAFYKSKIFWEWLVLFSKELHHNFSVFSHRQVFSLKQSIKYRQSKLRLIKIISLANKTFALLNNISGVLCLPTEHCCFESSQANHRFFNATLKVICALHKVMMVKAFTDISALHCTYIVLALKKTQKSCLYWSFLMHLVFFKENFR